MMENKTVFVCFVQNNLGVLQGEEVISCLMVTQSQDKIDSWLDRMLVEAAENGYFPEEDVDSYKDTYDYELAVSKGNDAEGYDTYYFVCKQVVVE